MELKYREATEEDLQFMVDMLADDELGSQREDVSIPLNPSYLCAFQNITSDANNELRIVEIDNEIIGMLQLTFIPYLTHLGSWRCLVEGVRIHKNYRSQGIGTQIFEWLIEYAKTKNVDILQLTSDKKRPNALKFYLGLGFEMTHEGFKLKL
ncbi:MAG: GNAT family N-acetyltransferase [SAR324 cluster bacterium]|nr:GNAT family N-acetyltransferase [SAR324 cluster bacterium]MBL7034591.1 GNAT family N-acetyltransferase [SAR324 cluster bacterium]